MKTPKKKPLHKTFVAKLFGGKTRVSKALLGALDVVPILGGLQNVIKSAVKKSEHGALNITLAELPQYISAKYEVSRGAAQLIVFGIIVLLFWGDADFDLKAIIQILHALLGGGVAAMLMGVMGSNPLKSGQTVKMLPIESDNDTEIDPSNQSLWVGSHRIWPGDTFTLSEDVPFGLHVVDEKYVLHTMTANGFRNRFEVIHDTKSEDADDKPAAVAGKRKSKYIQ